jgi:FdhD protein
MMMKAERDFPVQRLGLAEPGDETLRRALATEAPVAIEYGGIGYAVMLATPTDLEAYVTGLSLSEGLVRSAAEIEAIDIHEVAHGTGAGWIVRVTLPADRMEAVIARARTRVSESSCGLCGIENIGEVLRPLPKVTARISVTREAIAAALAELPAHQPLGRQTGAVHAAAFCNADGRILHVCEDVGRHNALDKLIGTLAIKGISPSDGFILLSARCSYELVEKVVRAGCPLLVAISAPTTLAVERATAAGLTLVALARADSALILSDPHGSVG